MNDIDFTRYSRQTVLPEFGIAGQLRLKSSSVLVIGAGGLGCPALQYLVGAGVGNVGVVDGDRVSLDNLHRQVLYQESDIGNSKAETAVARLGMLNSSCRLVSYPYHFDTDSARTLVSMYDLVLDCTDDYTVRYLVADTCLFLKKPLVFGAVHRFEGQVSVFDASGGFTLRDLFPEDPDAVTLRTCAEDGVLGMLTGIVGCVQASEAIGLIVNGTSPLIGKVWTFDIRSLRSEMFTYSPQGQAYHTASTSKPEDAVSFQELAAPPQGAVLLDVREEHEVEIVSGADSNVLRISLHRLLEEADRIPRNRPVAVFCETGSRSRIAARLLIDRLGFRSVSCIPKPEQR